MSEGVAVLAALVASTMAIAGQAQPTICRSGQKMRDEIGFRVDD
jgi:hypothetical protein